MKNQRKKHQHASMSSNEESLPLKLKLRVLSRVANAAVGGLLKGSDRPHRSRTTEAIVRGAQTLLSAKGLSLHGVRELQKDNASPPRGFSYTAKRWTAALGDAPTSGDLPVVRVDPYVHDKYASADAPRVWDVSGEWMALKSFKPGEPKDGRVVLFFHGGAYIMNDVSGYRKFLAPLVKAIGLRFFNVEYRLAPEHPFPAALHDAVSAFLYLTQVEKIPAENIVVAGDSAGGNLASILTMFLRDLQLPTPAAQVLISPWVDMTHDLPSEKEHLVYDILGGFSKHAEGGANLDAVAMYLGAHRTADEREAMAKTERLVSPICDPGSHFQTMPPTYMVSGGDEMMLDAHILYGSCLIRMFGGPSVVVHDIFEYEVHIFPFMTPNVKGAAVFHQRFAHFVNHVVPASNDTPGYQVTLIQNGHINGRGLEAAWLPRWPGIRKVKGGMNGWSPGLSRDVVRDVFKIGMRQFPVLLQSLAAAPDRPNRSRLVNSVIRTMRSFLERQEITIPQLRAIMAAAVNLGGSVIMSQLRGIKLEPREWTAKLEVVPEGKDPASVVAPPSQSKKVGDAVVARSSLPTRYPRGDLASPWKVTGEWMTPETPTCDPKRVVLYFHGGAFVFCTVASYRPLLGPLVRAVDRRVFSVEYRLSPECAFPDALHDAVAAYLYLTETEGIAPEYITVMGDSAGGNMAISLLLFLRDHGYAQPGGAVLISPWSDMAQDLPSYTQNLDYDFLHTGGPDRTIDPVSMYCGRADHAEMTASEHLVSAVVDQGRAGAPALPPIYISTGTDELLLDPNVLLAANLARIPGAPPVLVHDVHEHQVHIFPLALPFSRDATWFYRRTRAFLHQVVDDNGSGRREMKDDGGGAVEVAYVRDGKLVERGLDMAWMARWPGIARVKGLGWDPRAIAGKLGKVLKTNEHHHGRH
ncbi:hypothetical protein H9P43_004346 [Blastocladiella emersonii ATCC 22665]|nr:hypothetical protein H9P43_004346 [Blastocladiella emersonii ATCC 22665]